MLVTAMSTGLVTAKQNDGVYETIQLMRSRGVRRMPIIDAKGALIGIVSLDDIVELMAEELGEVTHLMHQERRKELEARR